MTRSISPVHADDELRPLLARISAGFSGTDANAVSDVSQDHADHLLARIVWARLAEPGDRTAGALIETLGPVELLRMLSTGVTAKRITATVHERTGEDGTDQRAVTAGLKRWLPRLDRAATLEDLRRSAEARYRVLVPSDDLWPERLTDLGDSAPMALWVRGDHTRLVSPAFAIVGARAATGYGEHVTAELVDGLGRAGYTIISGAAYGIDGAAHRTALATDALTVAVLAGGIDRPYPEAHRQLLDRIADTGAVCSEMVPGSAPTRWRFLQRNRLIASLSNATVITEAGIRSGSLNTAGHAAEIGRPLGAVPGPVTSAASAGCHKLIREYGASLVTGAVEALELVGSSNLAATDAAHVSLSRQPELHRRILDALPLRGSRTLDDAARRAGVSTEDARGVIAELELLRFVRRHETPQVGEVAWSLQRRE